MSTITPIGWEAQAHRETYIAVLHGHLRQPGTKKAFAAKVGISPQYLSYLLDPYNHRVPSPDTAKAIVQALPLSHYEQEHVYEHLVLAGDRAAQAPSQPALLDDAEVSAHGDDLLRLFRTAFYTADPTKAFTLTTKAGAAAHHFLEHVDGWRHPLDYAAVALVMHEISLLRDQTARALYYAKRAQMILAQADESLLRPQWERARNLYTNAMRFEAVVYNRLHLHREAVDVLTQAERTPGAEANPGFWLPHLYRDRLLALANQPRSALAEAEALTQRGTAAAEAHNGPDMELLVTLLEMGLVRALLRHNRAAQAVRLAGQLVERLDHLPRVGTKHRVLLNLTHAEALWQTQQLDEWRSLVKRTLTLAAEAALTFALARIHALYGRAVAPLLTELAPHVVQRYTALAAV